MRHIEEAIKHKLIATVSVSVCLCVVAFASWIKYPFMFYEVFFSTEEIDTRARFPILR